MNTFVRKPRRAVQRYTFSHRPASNRAAHTSSYPRAHSSCRASSHGGTDSVPDIRIEEDDLAQILAMHTRLTRYALRSASFSVEGYSIRGFRGQIALQFAGNDMVRRILGTLLAFCPLCGTRHQNRPRHGRDRDTYLEG